MRLCNSLWGSMGRNLLLSRADGITTPAVISSLSAGTQTAGDVAVSYAIDKDDSAVQYRLFEAADATDAAAAAAANFSGYTVNDSGTVALTVSGSPANITIVSGLDSDALVSLDYFLAFRPAGSTVWSITGAIDLDTTDPVLSLATGTQTGQTTANISVSTTEGQGTLWRAVYPAASPPADIAALKAGTGAAWSGNGTPTAGVNAFSATGLTAGTQYRPWFLQEDEQGNQNPSGMVSGATFTTASAAWSPSDETSLEFHIDPSDAAWNVETNGGAEQGFGASPDKTGNYALTPGSFSVRTYGSLEINSLVAISSNGSGRFRELSPALTQGSGDFLVLAVIEVPTAVGLHNGHILITNNNSNDRRMGLLVNSSGNVQGACRASASTLETLLTTETISLDTPHIVGFYKSGTTLGVFLDGNAPITNATAEAWSGATGDTGLFANPANDSAADYDGLTGEMMAFYDFDATLFANAKSYLAAKWGVTL